MSDANNESGFEFKMIFEMMDGVPLPLLENEPPAADGVTFLNPAQCAAQLGGTEQSWADRWRKMFGKFLPKLGQGILEVAAGAATDSSAAAAPGASDPVRRAVLSVGTLAMRAVRFPHLTDKQFDLLLEECRRAQVHPMDVWVQLRKNEENDEIEPVIITTIKIFRAKAAATGLRRGESAPEFCGPDGKWCPSPWVKEEPPFAARVRITRTDTDEAFEGIAYWKSCAQLDRNAKGEVVYNEFWEKGGPHMLGKCASSAGYRIAFASLFGNLYTTDEITVPRGKTRPAELEAAAEEPTPVSTGAASSFAPAPIVVKPSGPAAIPDDPRLAVELVDESTPGLTRLPLELVLNGPCSNVVEARAFIDKCLKLWPKIFRTGEKAFCALVMKSANDGPGAAAA